MQSWCHRFPQGAGSKEPDCIPKARHRMEMVPDAILNTKFLFYLVTVSPQNGPFAPLRLGVPIQKNGAINTKPLE